MTSPSIPNLTPTLTHTLTIEKLGVQGDGLVHYNDALLSLPFTLPQEEVQVSVPPKGKPVVQSIVTQSPARRDAACPHFTQCGGCVMQHLQEQPYLEWKASIVRGALAQHGLHDITILPTLAVPPHSRRRLTLAALSRKNAPPILGFNARASHSLIDLHTCPITRPALLELLPLLRQTLAPWLDKAKTLDISLTLTTSGVDIVFTGAAPPQKLNVQESLAALMRNPAIARLSWRKTDRQKPTLLLMERQPMMSFEGVPVPLPAGGFLQPSLEGEQSLIATIRKGLDGVTGRIADLFAGCGTFSFPLAQQGVVTAFEGDEDLVKALTLGAHHCKNVTAQQRDLFRDCLDEDELNDFQAVVLDPPRAGAQAQCNRLAESDVPRVVMVSCHAGTFARDAETLVNGGYRLAWVQPIDQFLWSNHVEMVGLFTK